MKATIGLEIHVQLRTLSKLFCSCSTDIDEKEPNTEVCPICLGYPGSKPMLNRKAVDHGIIIAQALDSSIMPVIRFSRKNYFYPDMAKNYQITQYEVPLAEGGYLLVGDHRIGITRIHIEEDPAKLIHVGGGITTARETLIDYNRAGVPLVEIVTEPDIESTEEARAFLDKLSLILEHLGAYDPHGEGSLRVDANVSLDGGNRVEVKNITGFRNVEKALNYEVVRQSSANNMGLAIVRETRHFDAETGVTITLRLKEQEEDYGYIAEPDLTQISISEAWIQGLKASMPELPDQRIQRLVEQYGITRLQSNILVNTGLKMSEFYEECCRLYQDPKNIANWLITYLLKSLNYEGMNLEDSSVNPVTFTELLTLIDEGTISERLAKELIKDYVKTGESPRKLVKEKGLALLPVDELRGVVSEVVSENHKAVMDYRSGTAKAAEYLIGQVLRRVRARASASMVRELVLEALKEN
ncbi:Asp-tRNA(Asn)/Glu-tRNA(Gln) amidotransferase subunit GatB [Candidatus Bathyarchaeota archaeon]|nr:MAG: Asp-tRNA(Asn)/Glu-tRNA(Gln) amidotransferase subunit GatB [Candidatus Bathyarchaeota archaeon]